MLKGRGTFTSGVSSTHPLLMGAAEPSTAGCLPPPSGLLMGPRQHLVNSHFRNSQWLYKDNSGQSCFIREVSGAYKCFKQLAQVHTDGHYGLCKLSAHPYQHRYRKADLRPQTRMALNSVTPIGLAVLSTVVVIRADIYRPHTEKPSAMWEILHQGAVNWHSARMAYIRGRRQIYHS